MQALQILEAAYGKSDYRYGHVLMNVAILNNQRGRPNEARLWWREAVEVCTFLHLRITVIVSEITNIPGSLPNGLRQYFT